MSRLLSWFLLPLQLSVFLLLHLSYGVYRVYFHIKHRPRHLVTEATDLEQHAATWKAHKLPNHLAVAFAPPPKTLISAWRVKSRKKRQQQLLEDAARFVDWAQRAGIQRVSVFDSQGCPIENKDSNSLEC